MHRQVLGRAEAKARAQASSRVQLQPSDSKGECWHDLHTWGQQEVPTQ